MLCATGRGRFGAVSGDYGVLGGYGDEVTEDREVKETFLKRRTKEERRTREIDIIFMPITHLSKSSAFSAPSLRSLREKTVLWFPDA
jgi:hypothetical protein